jgi:hypothetical protein
LKIYFSEFKRCEDSTSIKTIRIVDFLKVRGRANCRNPSLHAKVRTIRAARAAGKSIRAIAREYGVGIGTVSRLTA